MLSHFLCKFFSKNVHEKLKQNLPSNSMSTNNKCYLNFCAFNHRNPYCTNCNKYSRIALKFMPQKLCMLPQELCQTVPRFLYLINHLKVCAQTVLYGNVQFLLESCVSIKCRSYCLGFSANNLMQVVLSSRFVLFN